MEQFRDCVAVVTGGGSGIGRGLALACADAGMHVVVSDIEAAKAETVAAEVRDRGRRAIALRTDVADAASVEALAARVYEEFGAVHLLCSNAGVITYRPLAEATAADWQWLFSVNLWGAIHCVQAFLPRMRDQDGERHILFTASIAGLAPALGGLGIYTSSKYALVGYAEVLRAELESEGIGVSAFCPGTVTTDIRGAGRNRPAEFGGPEPPPADRPYQAEGMDPLEAGRRALQGVRANRLYVLSHRNMRSRIDQRVAHILADDDEAAAEEPQAAAR